MFSTIIALLILLITPALYAGNITASVDKTQLGLNDSMRLEVTLSGSGKMPDPALPDLSNFSVYSSGRAQNISIVNGQMSASITYNYILAPRKPGKFTIGSFQATIDGQTLQTAPIAVEVLEGTAAQPASASVGSSQAQAQSQGAFIETELSHSKAYVNQEVLLTFRFYCRVPLAATPQYQPPDLTGFITSDLPPPRHGTRTINGVNYNVTEIKTALFPTQEGRITIPPARLVIAVQDIRQDPFSDDFLRQFFQMGRARQVQLESKPIHLTVSALPNAPHPELFFGAVGQFSLRAETDKTQLKAGEALTLKITMHGRGNLKSTGDVALPNFEGFRKYDTASSLNLNQQGEGLEGSKVYQVVLVPQVSGKLTIPAIKMEYFDLNTRSYKTATTAPIAISVAQGDVSAPVMVTSGIVQNETALKQDIAYVQTEWPGKKIRIWQKLWHPWAALGIAFLFFMTGLLRWGRIKWIEKNPERYRASRAQKQFIAKTEKISKQSDHAMAELSDAFAYYWADRMGIPAPQVTQKRLREFLSTNGVSASILDAAETLWQQFTEQRYAPKTGAVDMHHWIDQTKEIIQKVEIALPKKVQPLNKGTFAVLLLFVLFSVMKSHAEESAARSSFQNANAAYQKGNWQEAAMLYQQSLDSVAAPETYFNLGNANYQMNRLGWAHYWWLKSFRVNPLDGAVRQNLDIVAAKLGIPWRPNFFLTRGLWHIYWALPLNGIFALVLVSLMLGLSYWGWRLGWKSKKHLPRTLEWGGAVILLGLCLWWGLRSSEQLLKKSGVVVNPDSELRSGPGMDFKSGGTISLGEDVQIFDTDPSGEWLEIGISRKGTKGWVHKDFIATL